MSRSLIPLAFLLLSASWTQAADDPALIEQDETLLRSAEVRADGPGLLDYLRRRIPRAATGPGSRP